MSDSWNKKSKSFGNLDNYKKMHEKTAKKKNVSEIFQKTQTLTKARIVLFGKSVKSHSKYKGHPDWK